ncbi:MAG TPA: calcium-binding protein [Thermoleophilaceae bacterium]|nr:calcium-binding protein [Thermoleophilaceae bacterium]
MPSHETRLAAELSRLGHQVHLVDARGPDTGERLAAAADALSAKGSRVALAGRGRDASAAAWAAAELGPAVASLVAVGAHFTDVADRLGSVTASTLLVGRGRDTKRATRLFTSAERVLAVRCDAEAAIPDSRLAQVTGDWIAGGPRLSRAERRALARRFQAILEDQVRLATGRSPRRQRHLIGAGATALAAAVAVGLIPDGARAAVNASVVGNVLSISTTAGEDVQVLCVDPGDGSQPLVKLVVDGGAPQNPGTGPAQCTSLTGIAIGSAVASDPGDNVYDLSAVDNDEFSAGAFSTVSVFGGLGSDTIHMSPGKQDSIDAGDGNDLIVQGDTSTTADTVGGGTGIDTIQGNGSDLTIVGTTGGNATLSGNLGTDPLTGVERAKFIGTEGADRLRAFDGATTYNGVVTLLGAGGADTLVGGDAGDSISGGAGADDIMGISASDMISGGDGVDTIDAGGGTSDRLIETFDADQTLTNSTYTAGSETDLISGFERAELSGGASANSIDVSAFSPAGGFTTVRGGAGADVITGSGLVDQLEGGDGADSIGGGAGSDAVLGGNDGDTLDGGAGEDGVQGDAGDDFVGGGSGSTMETISGGAGTDTLSEDVSGSAVLANSALTGAPGTRSLVEIERAWLRGGDAADSLDASAFPLPVTLAGGAGADTLRGGSSSDSLAGGAGNDALTGNGGTDSLAGGGDSDKVVQAGDTSFTLSDSSLAAAGGGFATDSLATIEAAEISGGAGANTLDASGFTGTAALDGAGGDDSLTGGTGDDSLTGGAGTDRVSASGPGSMTLTGTSLDATAAGVGTDSLSGVESASLTAGAGADTLDASGFTGSADLDGAGGDDSLRPASGGGALTGGDGDDDVTRGAGAADEDATLSGGTLTIGSAAHALSGIEALDLDFGDGANDVDLGEFAGTITIDTGGGDDDVTTGSGADTIGSGDGVDTVAAGAGDDSLDGGAANDSLDGGDDTDSIAVTADSDMTLTDASLAVGPETDTLAGIEKASLTGGDSPNTLDASGFTGTASLAGLGGDDTLSGGTGDDSLDGGDGDDTVSATRDGSQAVTGTAFTAGTETDSLTAIERAALTGGAGADALDASAFPGPATLAGMGGDDTLAGGDADDALTGGDGADSLTGGAGTDSFDAGDGDDTVGSQDGLAEAQIACGAGQDTLTADTADAVPDDCETASNRVTPPGGSGSGTGTGTGDGSGTGTGGGTGGSLIVPSPNPETGGGQTTTRDRRRPQVSVVRIGADSRGRLIATIRCNETCRGTYTLRGRYRGAKRVSTIGKGRVSGRAGRHTLRIKLSSRTLARIRRQGRIVARLTLTVRDPAGNVGRRVVRVVVRAPARRTASS